MRDVAGDLGTRGWPDENPTSYRYLENVFSVQTEILRKSCVVQSDITDYLVKSYNDKSNYIQQRTRFTRVHGIYTV